MGKKLSKLFELIEDIETAMMTTRRKDGHLVSRAMATQKRVPGADLWFVTDERSDKLHEIENDAHVNLAYYKDRTREWVSISGIATISRDRRKIRQLYAEDWRAWFPDEGDARHGTPEDPRMVLIGVKIHTGFYLAINKPQPVVLFELVKGMIMKEAPRLGSVRGIGSDGRRISTQSKATRERSTAKSGSTSAGTKRGGTAKRASSTAASTRGATKRALPAAKGSGSSGGRRATRKSS
jgi:general stress protein 26